jgi:hypothetical protein
MENLLISYLRLKRRDDLRIYDAMNYQKASSSIHLAAAEIAAAKKAVAWLRLYHTEIADKDMPGLLKLAGHRISDISGALRAEASGRKKKGGQK